MRIVAALLALAACGDDAPEVFGDPRTIDLTFPSQPNRKLDLLFVVYNSPGGAETYNLAGRVSALLDAVTSVSSTLPDVHIGVISTDMGTTGSNAPLMPGAPLGQVGSGGCSGAGDDGKLSTFGHTSTEEFFIDEADGIGGRRRNFTGDLATAVGSAIRARGQGGCAFEQPLHATRRALENPANAGFLRADAHLAIVITSAEDDCSALDASLFSADTTTLGPVSSFRCAKQGVVCDQPIDELGTKTGCRPRDDSTVIEPVARTIDTLRGVKHDPSLLSVAAVAGPASPFVVENRSPPGGGTPYPELGHVCGFTGALGLEIANPAVRLPAVTAAFGGRGTTASICSADYGPALREVGRILKHPLGVICLDASRLTITSTPQGLQPACELTEIIGDTETRITDYTIAPDAAACPETPDHLRLVVRGASTTSGAYIRARCETPF